MPFMLKKYLTTLADRYFEKRMAGPAPEKRWHGLYDVPLDDLKQRALSGDADAAFVLGDIYDQGSCNVTLDRAQAVEWYEKAAALGHGDAMNNIASMYQHGDGPFPVDLLKARDYYERGVKAGCSTAMGNLGHFYANGRAGLKQDQRRAVKLFSQGAHYGDSDSMVSLGHRYSTGTGIRKSPAQALYWYRRALQAGNPRGANNLGVAYYYGTIVKKDAEKGVLLFFAALEGGFERSSYTLGLANEEGKGTERDLEEALYLFRRARADDHEDADEAIERVLRKMGEEFSPAVDPEQRLEDLRIMIRDPEKRFSVEALLLELARVCEQLVEDKENPAVDQAHVLGRSNLIRGFVLWKQRNPTYVEPVETALAIDGRGPFLTQPERASLMTARAVAFARDHKWQEAVELHRGVLTIVKADPETEGNVVLATMTDLAFCLHEAAEFEEACKLNTEALARAEISFGKDDPALLRIIGNLAQNEFALDHPNRSVELMRRQLAIAEQHEILDVIGTTLRDLAIASFSAGDLAGAEDLFRRQVAFAERNGDSDDIARARADLDGLFEHLEKMSR
jgi:TPR repeat protein